MTFYDASNSRIRELYKNTGIFTGLRRCFNLTGKPISRLLDLLKSKRRIDTSLIVQKYLLLHTLTVVEITSGKHLVLSFLKSHLKKNCWWM